MLASAALSTPRSCSLRLAATLRVELATGDDESARKSAARLTAISDADDHALLAIDAVLAAGDAVRAVAALDTRVENARAASNANLEGAALVRRSLALALLGDCEAAGADASRAMALARARFAPSAYVSAARLVVMSLLEREMIDQALDQLDDAVGWLERTGAGTRALMMTVFEANVQLEATGDPELPGDHEDMLRHGTTLNHPQAATLAHISLARLAHGQGDEVAAQEHLGSAKALDARGALGLHDLIERVSHAMNLYAASA